MELQLLEKGWDSSDVLYAMCLKWFGIKRTRQICFGLVFAENAQFGKKNEISVLEGV